MYKYQMIKLEIKLNIVSHVQAIFSVNALYYTYIHISILHDLKGLQQQNQSTIHDENSCGKQENYFIFSFAGIIKRYPL